MKLTRLIVFLFIALVAVSVSTHAQSINSENLKQVKVDELSDAEIKTYYQKAVNAGLTESQLYKMATDRGMPESEISKLRLRIAGLNMLADAQSKKDTQQAKGEVTSERKVDDDAMKVPMQKNNRDTTVFGSELFRESSAVRAA